MAITLVIGNSARLSPSLFQSSDTVSSTIATQFNEALGLQQSSLEELALLLLLITFSVNLLARLVTRRAAIRLGGHS
jgi:phosphate transport system permease protein